MQKNHFLWIGVILALFFVGDRGLAFLQKRMVDGSQFRYTRMYSGKAQADMLLVGNSRGLMFYEPYIEKTLGNKTFNLSYNGLPAQLSEALIADYLDKYPAPKNALIEITHADRLNNTLVGGFLTYAKDSKRISALNERVNRNLYYSTFVANTVAYNNEVFQRTLAYRNRIDNDWLLDRVITDDLANNAGLGKVDSMLVDSTILVSLKRSCDLLTAKGTKVHLVLNPYFPPYAKRIPNLQAFKQAVERATGLPVLDYSLRLEDKKYFGDLQHVNVAGAEVMLKDMLGELGLL